MQDSFVTNRLRKDGNSEDGHHTTLKADLVELCNCIFVSLSLYCIVFASTQILINRNAIKDGEKLNRDGENASEPDGSEEAET